MPGDWHLYLDSNQLATRGWTAALIERFLGKPDLWMPVNHWANWKGKRTYFLERIELAEASPEFQAEFAKSARRRKLSKKQLTAFEKCRAESCGAVAKWRKEEAKAAAERQSGPASPSEGADNPDQQRYGEWLAQQSPEQIRQLVENLGPLISAMEQAPESGDSAALASDRMPEPGARASDLDQSSSQLAADKEGELLSRIDPDGEMLDAFGL